jgi:hypothetical protein
MCGARPRSDSATMTGQNAEATVALLEVFFQLQKAAKKPDRGSCGQASAANDRHV